MPTTNVTLEIREHFSVYGSITWTLYCLYRSKTAFLPETPGSRRLPWSGASWCRRGRTCTPTTTGDRPHCSDAPQTLRLSSLPSLGSMGELPATFLGELETVRVCVYVCVCVCVCVRACVRVYWDIEIGMVGNLSVRVYNNPVCLPPKCERNAMPCSSHSQGPSWNLNAQSLIPLAAKCEYDCVRMCDVHTCRGHTSINM